MSSAGSGIRAWLLQRLSAVYMLVFSIGMFFYINTHLPLDYTGWHALFSQTWLKLSWALMFVLLILHAWVGVRNVIIDYINSFAMRFFLYATVIISLGVMMIWSLQVTLIGSAV